MRGSSCLAGLLLCAGVSAQSPDVVLKVDINPHFRVDADDITFFRWYDTLGKHSTVGLSMFLETGFRLLATERIQRMPSDDDQLDEFYLEDEGSWRVGKQYLPFGRDGLIHESVRAIRAESNLLIEGLPIVVAACDGGSGRQRGIIGRIGTVIGLSFAFGSNFGISGTSLAVVRDPDSAPGKGRGFEHVIGLDYFRRVGSWKMSAELVAMRGGETALDENKEVSDVVFSIQPTINMGISLGWSRDWSEGVNFLRAQGQVLLTRGVWLEPIVRFRDASFYDGGISLRAKL